MNILSLNVWWGGKLGEPLLAFLEEEAKRMDVLCLQEVIDTPTDVREENGTNLAFLKDLRARLPGFDVHTAWMIDGMDQDGDVSVPMRFGSATFIRSTMPPDRVESAYVHGSFPPIPGGRHPRVLLCATWDALDLTIANFHGMPGDEKRDTPARLAQSKRVREVLDSLQTRWVLCGDFNLHPDTQSLAILEVGGRNLVRESGARTTRSSHYVKHAAQPFADYAVVSPGVVVRSFEVLPIEVSDHLPMRFEVT